MLNANIEIHQLRRSSRRCTGRQRTCALTVWWASEVLGDSQSLYAMAVHPYLISLAVVLR